MATIARMVVEMLGDASQLRREMAQTTRDAATFGRGLQQAMSNQPLVSSANAARQGRQAATALVQALNRQYDVDIAYTREARARGVIGEGEMRVAGEHAAVAFNKSLLDGINTLRTQGMLSPATHARLVSELKDVGFDAGKAAREEFQKQMSELSGTLNNIGRNLSTAGRRATVGITLPVVGAGVAGVKEAADAAESLNKFQVIFGRTSETVNQQLARLHSSIPATTAQLQDQASSFGGLLKAMGITGAESDRMAVRLVRLGGDLTSLHNVPVQETMQRLFSGLVGETEAVRRFGVDISEARLKVLAHNAGLGDNVQALTRAQKTQLIYNELLRATANATGDAASTSASAANQFRFLQRDATEAAIAFGQRLLPSVIPIVAALSRVLVAMAQLSPGTLDLIIKVALFAAAVGPLLIVLGSLFSAIGTIVGALGILGPAIAGAAALLAGPAGWIVLIGAATAALLGWVAATHAAAPSADALAQSFRGLSTAQMVNEMAELSRKIQALRQSAAADERALGSNAGRLNTGARGDLQGITNDPARARLAETNKVIAEMQTRLDALGIAINRNSADANKQAADLEALMRRSDAATKAMLAGLGGNAFAADAAAKAAKKALHEQLQEMAGQASTLNDLRVQGEAYHQNLAGVNSQALQMFNTVQRMLDAHGDVFDATTARLLNMKAELLKFSEVARAEALRTLDVAKLIQLTPNAEQARINRSIATVGAQNTQPVATFPQVTVLPVRPGAIVPNGPNERGPAVIPQAVDESSQRFRLAVTGMLDALGLSRQQLREFAREVRSVTTDVVEGVRPLGQFLARVVQALPAPIREAAQTVANEVVGLGRELGDRVRGILAPIGTVVSEVASEIGGRLRPALDLATVGLNVMAVAVRSVRAAAQPVISAFGDLLNPITFFGGVMQEIAGALRPVFEPLRASIGRIVTVVARGLQPVFEALAPVIDALVPLIRAIMQVLGPILAALAPLFRAFIPILEALFPIFKLVAIAATYVAQAFGIVAAVVLRAVGNIIIGLGKIVEAFARAVDALPFVSAKGAIRTAQGIQDFGRALLHSADEMNNMANDMAHAREQIRNVGLDHSADDAADALDNTADAARAVTEALNYVPQIFRYRARLVETWDPRELGGMSTGVPPTPVDTRPSIPGGGDTFIVHQLNINEAADGRVTLDDLRRQARRESMATYGTTDRAGDVLAG